MGKIKCESMKIIRLIIIGIWIIITMGAIQQFKHGREKTKDNYARLQKKEHRVIITSNGLLCDIDAESCMDDRIWLIPFGWIVVSCIGFGILKDLK